MDPTQSGPNNDPPEDEETEMEKLLEDVLVEIRDINTFDEFKRIKQWLSKFKQQVSLRKNQKTTIELEKQT